MRVNFGIYTLGEQLRVAKSTQQILIAKERAALEQNELSKGQKRERNLAQELAQQQKDKSFLGKLKKYFEQVKYPKTTLQNMSVDVEGGMKAIVQTEKPIKPEKDKKNQAKQTTTVEFVGGSSAARNNILKKGGTQPLRENFSSQGISLGEKLRRCCSKVKMSFNRQIESIVEQKTNAAAIDPDI